MTYEEFLERALKVGELDKDLGRQFRNLYQEQGTLVQMVRALLDMRDDYKESLAGAYLLDEAAIRKAAGTQGMIQGVDQVLHWIHSEIVKVEHGRNTEPSDDDGDFGPGSGLAP